MDIYIKPVKKISVSKQNHIRAGDVCEVHAPGDLKEQVENIKILKTDDVKKKIYLVSVLDIISAINKSIPGHTVNNVGEIDTVVEYHRKEIKDNPVFKWFKVVFISLIFAVGAATAIMTFHNDAQIPKLFKTYYKIFTGKESENPRVIQIPYAIGLAAGIIFFFNHIGGKKISDDPSPIEIEMSDYDKTVTEVLVDFLSVKKSQGGLSKPGKYKNGSGSDGVS